MRNVVDHDSNGWRRWWWLEKLVPSAVEGDDVGE